LFLNAVAYAIGTSTPSAITVSSITADANNVTLTWAGGNPPFIVQRRDSLSTGTWTDMVTNTVRTVTVPRTGTAGFLRVAGQ
jgi:hypothetical protein